MKSKAAIGGHPIHPMLIPFPIAFLTGAIVFDILSRVRVSEPLYTTAYHCLVAGLIMGVLAAIAGAVDFRYAIPADTPAKNKATYHLIVNGLGLVLFSLSLFMRPSFVDRNTISMLPAYAGAILLGIGGWLGGSLVYDEKVGINEPLSELGVPSPSRWTRPGEDIGISAQH